MNREILVRSSRSKYCTLEPSLRYMFNAKEYVKDLTSDVEAGTISAEEFVLHTERVFNTVSGVYETCSTGTSASSTSARSTATTRRRSSGMAAFAIACRAPEYFFTAHLHSEKRCEPRAVPTCGSQAA